MSRLKLTKVCSTKCFFTGFENKFRVIGNDSQAAATDRNAVTQSDLSDRKTSRIRQNRKAHADRETFNMSDSALSFHETGEHSSQFGKSNGI
jgi:hypothetical protein